VELYDAETYTILNPEDHFEPIPFSTRIALRGGQRLTLHIPIEPIRDPLPGDTFYLVASMNALRNGMEASDEASTAIEVLQRPEGTTDITPVVAVSTASP